MNPVRLYCDRHHDRRELHRLYLTDIGYQTAAHDDLMDHLAASGIDTQSIEAPPVDPAAATLGDGVPIGDFYVHDDRTSRYDLWCPEDPKRHRVVLRSALLAELVRVLNHEGVEEVSLHGLRQLVNRATNR